MFAVSFSIIASVVYCGPPTKVENGYVVNATGSSYGSEAFYQCDSDFAMEGSADGKAVCNEIGDWSDKPVCRCMYFSLSRSVAW